MNKQRVERGDNVLKTIVPEEISIFSWFSLFLSDRTWLATGC